MIVLHDDLKTWFEAQGLRAHVTVTDETDHAASFVVVEKVDAYTPPAGPASSVPVRPGHET